MSLAGWALIGRTMDVERKMEEVKVVLGMIAVQGTAFEWVMKVVWMIKRVMELSSVMEVGQVVGVQN